jgi:hypothetical protein
MIARQRLLAVECFPRSVFLPAGPTALGQPSPSANGARRPPSVEAWSRVRVRVCVRTRVGSPRLHVHTHIHSKLSRNTRSTGRFFLDKKLRLLVYEFAVHVLTESVVLNCVLRKNLLVTLTTVTANALHTNTQSETHSSRYSHPIAIRYGTPRALQSHSSHPSCTSDESLRLEASVALPRRSRGSRAIWSRSLSPSLRCNSRSDSSISASVWRLCRQERELGRAPLRRHRRSYSRRGQARQGKCSRRGRRQLTLRRRRRSCSH